MDDTLKRYRDEICTVCKGECHKGITFIFDGSGVRCVDYVKDKTKIKKCIENKRTTAKQQRPIMRDLV